MGGVLAGGGIAIAALGSSFAFVTKTLSGLKWWQILSGIGGAILAVLIPSINIAAIRLSKRDLSCILEGSRWAINGRMRLSRRQRKFFTQNPRSPVREAINWERALLIAAIALTLVLLIYAVI